MEEKKTIDSTYIQQHLANERTLLAWIRTSVTIVGLGFLAAGIVFDTTPSQHIGHMVARIVGIGAIILGGFLSTYATREYFAKRNGINAETFRATQWIVVCLLTTMLLMDLFLLVLILILLFF